MEGNSEERSFGEVEERSDDQTEETQDEQVQDDQDGTQKDSTEQTDDQDGKEENQEENQGDGTEQPKLTEKGTKVDPNPQSAVHQELANEKKARGQMEQVLASPELTKKFLEQHYGIKVQFVDSPAEGEAEAENGAEGQKPVVTERKKWTAKDFDKIDDVANVVNQIQENFEAELAKRDTEIKTLKKGLGGLEQGGRVERVANTLTSDVTNLRTIPELNPKHADFVPGLEEQIAAHYADLDFDGKMFRGNYSLQKIAKPFIEAARSARAQGSKSAQTVVKTKVSGQVRTSAPVNGQTDRDTMKPGASIAAGIAQMFKR